MVAVTVVSRVLAVATVLVVSSVAMEMTVAVADVARAVARED